MHCIKEHVRRRRAIQEKLCASCVTSKAGNPTVFSQATNATNYRSKGSAKKQSL
jgi:hypothetical protein